MFEFVDLREINIDDPGIAIFSACEQTAKPVVALRADHQIDHRCARKHLAPLGLRHAAGHRDDGAAPLCLAGLFDLFQAAEFRIDFFSRLFADVAGIEDNQIGRFRRIGGAVAQFGKRFGHALGIIDIHLTAEGFDEVPFGVFGHGEVHSIN